MTNIVNSSGTASRLQSSNENSGSACSMIAPTSKDSASILDSLFKLFRRPGQAAEEEQSSRECSNPGANFVNLDDRCEPDPSVRKLINDLSREGVIVTDQSALMSLMEDPSRDIAQLIADSAPDRPVFIVSELPLAPQNKVPESTVFASKL